MKAFVISLWLMIASVIAYGQSYTLPSEVFDRMYFEVVRGRVCDTLQTYQAKELESQGKLLIAKDRALNLNTSLISTLEFEVSELRTVIVKSNQATVLKVKEAKRKGRVFGFISGVSLSGVVAIVLVLIL